MRGRLLLFSLVALTCVNVMAMPPKAPSKTDTATPQPSAAGDRWKPFRFLIGNWGGDGKGVAGQGFGNMTVETDLDESILRITNQVDFASGDRKTVYKGTMIVYGGQKALFFDNEGHVLHYTVTVGPNQIVFNSVSEPVPSLPHFRFTYDNLGDNKVKCSFDIAPPATPGKYTIHVSGIAAKK